MILCDRATLQAWTPDFSPSEQASPRWTRLVCDGLELCNSMEGTEWCDAPAQVIVCDACGCPGCASGGYVHISRLGRSLLWTTPEVNRADDFERTNYHAPPALAGRGCAVIPLRRWSAWRRRFANLPEAASFPRTRRIDLAQAWAMEGRAPGRGVLDRLAPVLRHGPDETEARESVAALRRLLGWVRSSPDQPVEGRLDGESAIPASVERLPVEVPGLPAEAWPSLARWGGAVTFAFGDGLVYVPGSDEAAH